MSQVRLVTVKMKRIGHYKRYFGDMIKGNCLWSNAGVKRCSKMVFGLSN